MVLVNKKTYLAQIKSIELEIRINLPLGNLIKVGAIAHLSAAVRLSLFAANTCMKNVTVVRITPMSILLVTAIERYATDQLLLAVLFNAQNLIIRHRLLLHNMLLLPLLLWLLTWRHVIIAIHVVAEFVLL